MRLLTGYLLPLKHLEYPVLRPKATTLSPTIWRAGASRAGAVCWDWAMRGPWHTNSSCCQHRSCKPGVHKAGRKPWFWSVAVLSY